MSGFCLLKFTTAPAVLQRNSCIKKIQVFLRQDMYEFTDKAFSKDFTKHCTLLLQLEEQQFSYAIYEKRTGRLQVLKTVSISGSGGYMNKLKVALTSEDLLHVAFQEIRIAFAQSPFTLIPRSMYEEQLNKKYLAFTAPVEEDDEILVNHIRSLFIKNIFSVEGDEMEYLREVFDKPKFFHISSALLESILQNKDELNPQQLLIDIKQNLMHLMYFENGEFKFLNQFRFTNKDDFLYFVLLVADQFQIDRTSCDMKLSGEIMPDAQLFSEIWKFFKTISFLPLNENIVLPAELNDKPMHFYNSLFSLDLCE